MEQQPTNGSPPAISDRRITRAEAHDLSMLIKDRAKVLKLHAEAEAARYLSEFEQQISQQYSFDQDDVWERAMQAVADEGRRAQEKVNARCKELGIPSQFAPIIHVVWQGRGQNMMAERRAELRRAAKAKIEAMIRNAQTKIEQQAVDLRTKILSMGVLSADGQMFLESLAPVEDAIGNVNFSEIAQELEAKRKASSQQRNLLGYSDD